MKRQFYTKAVIGLCLVALVIAGGYVLGRRLETARYANETVRGDLSTRQKDVWTVSYGGRDYTYNDRLISILLMGVDKEDEYVASGYRDGGQADFLLLIVIDPDNKNVLKIQIDRDTMTEITVLGVLGNVAGTRNAQICLSHGFGNSEAQRCGFTVDAVKQLLFGVDIDFYVMLKLDAIAAVNDAVGGVTVLIEDDFSAHDPAMKAGETLKLNGEQAELFVRSRMTVGEGTNRARMLRQRAYMTALTDMIAEATKKDANYINELFDLLGDSLVTDMTRGRMINEMSRAASFDQQSTVMLTGEHRMGTDGFVEFHADKQALEELVLGTFFIAEPPSK